MKSLLFILAFACVTSCSPTKTDYKDTHNLVPELPITAIDLAKGIREGQYSSEQTVKLYLDRINQLDRNGPKINSLISLNPDILKLARQRDTEVKQGKIRGRLHGVPIVVKDNIETSNMPTTGGSLALLENFTNRDAPIIARLKNEGAIVLGKTNLSEWANFRSNRGLSGWSAVGGITRNPHSLNRSPCGSSAGSAAAIASVFAPLALGTETNGSITCPASMNGIVGFKPTVGLLSNKRIIPISTTQDSAGPMGRTVSDATLMLDLMIEPRSDTQTRGNSSKYMSALEQDIKGTKIGVFRWAEGKDFEISKAFNQAVKVLESQGAIIKDISTFEPDPIMWQGAEKVLNAQFKHDLNAYLETLPANIQTRTLTDLIKFNESNSERELRIFDQSKFMESEQAQEISNPEHIKLLKDITSAAREKGIDKLLADNDVDVLIMPSAKLATPVDIAFSSRPAGGPVGASWLAAIAGYPSLPQS